MHVFQIKRCQQRPVLLPLKERDYEDLHRLAECWLHWGINKGRQDVIIQRGDLDGWYVLSKQLALHELQHGKRKNVVPKHIWLRAVHRSSLLHSSLEIRPPRYRILWGTACTEARVVCRPKSSATRATGRLRYGVVLGIEHGRVAIPHKTALLVRILSLTHLPSTLQQQCHSLLDSWFL